MRGLGSTADAWNSSTSVAAAARSLPLGAREAKAATVPELPHVPDHVALARRIAQGDAAALGGAYDAHHHAVRAFARRLTGSDAAAEDLVHDVFVALPGALRSFDGRSSLRTFILSVAVNYARNARRAIARRLGAMERLQNEPSSESESPEAHDERRRLAELFARLLDELPVDQRITVVLCVIEERTSVEAAEIVGVPEATVRTRLFHARRKLREGFERATSSVGRVA
jgi:RNA polymerase sigma-70 factor (ECF subfamily)